MLQLSEIQAEMRKEGSKCIFPNGCVAKYAGETLAELKTTKFQSLMSYARETDDEIAKIILEEGDDLDTQIDSRKQEIITNACAHCLYRALF